MGSRLYCRNWEACLPIGARRGFQRSKMIRPPRPILPWHRNGCAVATPSIGGAGGGLMPAISNFPRSSGLVNSITGSSGSCISQIWSTLKENYHNNQSSQSMLWTEHWGFFKTHEERTEVTSKMQLMIKKRNSVPFWIPRQSAEAFSSTRAHVLNVLMRWPIAFYQGAEGENQLFVNMVAQYLCHPNPNNRLHLIHIG
jgi:hypothetical protein